MTSAVITSIVEIINDTQISIEDAGNDVHVILQHQMPAWIQLMMANGALGTAAYLTALPGIGPLITEAGRERLPKVIEEVIAIEKEVSPPAQA